MTTNKFQNNQKPIWPIVYIASFLFVGLFAYFIYQKNTNANYHLQWSWTNLRQVWVDENGKVAP